MKLLNYKKTKLIFFFFIFLISILKFFNTPYNLYSILNWDYENRMEQNYGFCERESWGFYNFVIENYNLTKVDIRIINDEGFVTLENLFNIKESYSENAKFVILLNYLSENNEDIGNGKYNFLKNYSIQYRNKNCYLLNLND
mgnify:FL=1